MSYLTDSFSPRKDKQNLTYKHINYKPNEEIDILTIGDSFSRGGGQGTNRFYQDFIATNQKLKVMNIQPHKKGFIETVLILEKLNIFDSLKPKSIILQSVERNAIYRYSKIINWDISLNSKSISFLYKKYQRTIPKPSFINNLNYNALIYPQLYKYDDNAMFSQVYITQMSKKLFSCLNGKRLLFYFQDLTNIPLSNPKSIALLNRNLNKLQNILDKRNIKLYFMPTVDKYNLYSKYIQTNSYPTSTFFELLRLEKKEYTLIDTKMILEKMLDKNISDVYYSDDTHWSYKSIKEIFKKIYF